MTAEVKSPLSRVDEGIFRDRDGRQARHSVFQAVQPFGPSSPLKRTVDSHTHSFAIISEGASEAPAVAAAEVLHARGHLKPVAFIIVQDRCISFAVSFGSFYMNKHLKWGRWKQGVHFACRSTGYRDPIACAAFDQNGSLHVGRNCEIWSKFRASHMVDVDRRWDLYTPS